MFTPAGDKLLLHKITLWTIRRGKCTTTSTRKENKENNSHRRTLHWYWCRKLFAMRILCIHIRNILYTERTTKGNKEELKVRERTVERVKWSNCQARVKCALVYPFFLSTTIKRTSAGYEIMRMRSWKWMTSLVWRLCWAYIT